MIRELEQDIPVEECVDVLVVGGGSAGAPAAIAAARTGAKVVLLERYNHLGGMSTGGEVILIPSLSYGDQILIRGILLELLTKLEQCEDGFFGPDRTLAGSRKEEEIALWKNYFDMVCGGAVTYGGYVHPDLLKIALDELAVDSGVHIYLNCLSCKAIMDGTRVKGVIYESKEGRKAILAKQVVDCTGDGDIFASAGAAFEVGKDALVVKGDMQDTLHGLGRTTSLAIVYRLGGVDFKALLKYQQEQTEAWKAHEKKMIELSGFLCRIFPGNRNDVVWMNNWVLGYSSLVVKDVTDVEIMVRRSILPVLRYMHEQQIPGLEHAWLYDTAPQLGARGSRRVKGEYYMTVDDLNGKSTFEDVIAVFPPAVNHNLLKVPSTKHQLYYLLLLNYYSLSKILSNVFSISTTKLTTNVFLIINLCFSMSYTIPDIKELKEFNPNMVAISGFEPEPIANLIITEV